jgi:hydroxyethylthiazole kinase
MNIKSESIVADLNLIREKKSLIHNVTNYVSSEWVANGLLALGAAPVMAHAPEEIDDIIKISQALVLNIGTLDLSFVESMKLALNAAVSAGIPVVLDPVGAGATPYRTHVARELLLNGGITVVRGNPSEVYALAGGDPTTKGVESSLSPNEAYEASQKLFDEFGCVVVASGPDDLIVGPQVNVRVYNGTAMMSRVTGMGCLVSSIIGAFCTVQKDPTLAAAHAMIYACIVGEKAAMDCPGIGSYKVSYLDYLSDLEENWISKLLRAECYEKNT